MQEILSEAQQVKRGKDKMAKGPSMDANFRESGPEEALTYSKSKKRPNCRSGNKKNREDDQALVCRATKNRGKRKWKLGLTKFSLRKWYSKVRWNMNKGSERWLCYGGAAGLVHCQEIVLSDFDRKLAMKR